MRPPPDARPPGRRPLWIGLGALGVLVVALVLAVAAGLVAWRLLRPDSGGHESAGPLRIAPVTGTAPDACPSGGPGVGSVDGGTCYRLGGGGMTVRRLESAAAERDPSGGHWFVNVRLNDADARRFAQLTGRYVHRRLALVSAGKVLAAPAVQQAITGGALQIVGNFSADQAKKIASRLPT